MAGPWHSPCPRRHWELQGSRTRTRSGCRRWGWTKAKRVWVQFRLCWSMLLAGISGELLPLWLFLPWPKVSSSCLSVHKERPGSLPVPVPRERGTAPTWHCAGSQREIPWDEPMSLLPSHRLVENPPNPSIEDISLSRAHLHGWGEGRGTRMAMVSGGGLIVSATKTLCSSGPCWTLEHWRPEGPSSPQPTPDHRQPGDILLEGRDGLLGAGAGGCGDEAGWWAGGRWLGLDTGLSFLCADTRRLRLSEQLGR